MSLRVALVIDGDASGAKRAAAVASQALGDVGKSAGATLIPFDQARRASVTLAGAHAGISTQAMALGHVMRSTAEEIALGIPPTQILAQQVAHLSYAASGPGGLKGAFKEATGALSAFISPTALIVGGLGAVAAGGLLVYNSIKQTELQFGALSDRVNTSVQTLHAFESAAAFKGIDTGDFLKNMERFGTLTEDALHNTGSLAELLRTNGVAAGSLSDNLLHAADLIKNAASEAEKYRLIQQLGLPATREWVQYLSLGSDGLRQAAAGAVQFGGAADEQLIRKAREFDEAWNRSWKTFVTGGEWAFMTLTGSLVAFGHYMDGVVQSLNPNLLDVRLNNALSDVAGYSNKSLQSGLDARAAQLRSGGVTKNPEDVKRDLGLEQQRIGVLGNLASIQDTVRLSEIKVSEARLAGAKITGDDEARIRSYAAAQALGVIAIRQQTDAARIEGQAIGLGAGATAAFTAEQSKLADFRLRGIKLTQEQAAALHAEATALGATTQATAMRGAISNDQFQRSLIGLSSEEQQVATTLRGLYGDNWSKNMDGAVASTMRLTNALKTAHDTGLTFLQDFNTNLQQGQKWFQALEGAGLKALNTISNKLLEMAYNNLWKAAFSGGGGGGLLGLLGIGGGGFPSSFAAKGDVFSGPDIAALSGSVLTKPTFFRFATGTAVAGEAGDEGVLPLKRINGKLGVYAQIAAGRPPAQQASSTMGASVFNNNMGGIHVDASGADPATVARLQTALVEFRRNLASDVMRIVTDANSRGWRPRL